MEQVRLVDGKDEDGHGIAEGQADERAHHGIQKKLVGQGLADFHEAESEDLHRGDCPLPLGDVQRREVVDDHDGKQDGEGSM